MNDEQRKELKKMNSLLDNLKDYNNAIIAYRDHVISSIGMAFEIASETTSTHTFSYTYGLDLYEDLYKSVKACADNAGLYLKEVSVYQYARTHLMTYVKDLNHPDNFKDSITRINKESDRVSHVYNYLKSKNKTDLSFTLIAYRMELVQTSLTDIITNDNREQIDSLITMAVKLRKILHTLDKFVMVGVRCDTMEDLLHPNCILGYLGECAKVVYPLSFRFYVLCLTLVGYYKATGYSYLDLFDIEVAEIEDILDDIKVIECDN